jgi:hypothetical protein
MFLTQPVAHLQLSLSPADHFHPLYVSRNYECLVMMSFYLSCGLPTGLLPRNFQFSTFFFFFGSLVSSI